MLDGCNKKARRKFCSNKHKDRYHNINNPRGFYAHLNPNNMDAHDLMNLIHDEEHPYSGEASGAFTIDIIYRFPSHSATLVSDNTPSSTILTLIFLPPIFIVRGIFIIWIWYP